MAVEFDPYYTWLGIPPEEQPPDHYRLLGVRRFEANPDAISNASDQRMSHLRTFQSGKNSAASQKLLNELAAAARCLLDPALRPAYDKQLQAQDAAKKAAAPAPLVRAKALPAATAVRAEAVQPASPAPAVVVSQPTPIKAIPAKKTGKGSPLVLAIGGGAALVLVLGGVAVAWMMSNGSQPRPIAQQASPIQPAPPEPPPTTPVTPATKPPEPPPTEKQPVSPPPSPPSVVTPERPSQPPPTTPAPNSRLPYKVGEAWSYYTSFDGTAGVYRKTGPDVWIGNHSNGETATLRETAQTEEYVELQNPLKQLALRLYVDRMMIQRGGSSWQFSANGNWVTKLASVPPPPMNMPAAAVTDLLKTDWAAQTTSGGFRDSNGAKSSLGGDKPDQVEFQTEIPEEYVLLARFVRRGPNQGLAFHLPYGGRQVDLALNAQMVNQTWNGLEYIDGHKLDSGQNPTAFQGPTLQNDQAHRLEALVIRHHIQVKLDGKTIVNWKGHPSQVFPHPWTYLANPNHLGYTVWKTQVELLSLELRPLDSKIDWIEPLSKPTKTVNIAAGLTRTSLPTIAGQPPPVTTPAPAVVASTPNNTQGNPTPRVVGRFRGEARVDIKHDAQLIDPEQPFTAEMWFLVNKAEGPTVLWDFDGSRLWSPGEPPDAAGRSPLFMTLGGQQLMMKAPPLVGGWRHIAVQGDGKAVHILLDGKVLTSAQGFNLRQAWKSLMLGGSRDGALKFDGEILEFRVSKAKRYGFAPNWKPTSFALDADTRWLLTFTEGNQVRMLENGRDSALHHSWKNLFFDRRPIPVPAAPEAPPPITKEEPPQGEDLAAAKARVAETCKDKLKGATKADDKLKLARELLALSRAELKAPLAFALLAEARNLALGAVSVEASLEVANELERRFKVDRDAIVSKLLTELNTKPLTPDERDALTDEAAAMAQNCVANERFEFAETSAQLAFTSVNKGKDVDKKKLIKALRDRVLVLRKGSDAAQSAQEELKDSADDAAANLALGRYHAVLRGEFGKGLPYLAKGSDEKLAAAAQAEAAAKTDAERLAVADAWRTAADALKGDDKAALQRHALELYRQLVISLSGLDQAAADKRTKELEPLVAEADKANPLGYRSNRVSTKPEPGLIVRFLVADPSNSAAVPVPTPYLAIYRGVADLFRPASGEALRAYGSYQRMYVATGQLVLEKDCNVDFDLGFSTCKVGNQNVGSGNLNVPLRTSLPMKKGTYPVLISTRDSSPTLRIIQQDTGANLVFHTEKDLQAEMDKPVPLPKGGTSKGIRLDN